MINFKHDFINFKELLLEGNRTPVRGSAIIYAIHRTMMPIRKKL